jgi:hypothetical protein
MMKRSIVKIWAILILANTNAVWADDPCKLADILMEDHQIQPARDDISYNKGLKVCEVKRGGQAPLTYVIDELIVLARIVKATTNTENNVNSLRNEMAAAVNALTRAVEQLTTVSNALKANNDKWQQETLNKTISAIDEMPSKLAKVDELQNVLVNAIKEKLLIDAKFIDAVNAAKNK